MVCKPPDQSMIGCYGGRAKTSSRMLRSRTCRDLIIYRQGQPCQPRILWGKGDGKENPQLCRGCVWLQVSDWLCNLTVRSGGTSWCGLLCLPPPQQRYKSPGRCCSDGLAGPIPNEEQACASSWASLRATLEPESGTGFNKKDRRVGFPWFQHSL